MPGAKKILHLQALLSPAAVRHGPLKHKPKVFPRSSGDYQAVARQGYTGVPFRPRLRDNQIHSSSASVVDENSASVKDAYDELCALGFIKTWNARCLKCQAKISEPRPFVYPGKLYYKCKATSCQKRHNVCDYSIFKGTRLSLPDLLRVVTFYCRSNRSKSPLVTDAQAQLKMQRTAVEHIYSSIRAAEAKAGIAFCRRAKLSGSVEGDAQGLRKLYVSPQNGHFKEEIKDALRRWKSNKRNKGKLEPKYWHGSIRVCGLKQRDGEGVLTILPTKLTPPGAAPPPESTAEIVESGLLQRFDEKANSVLFSDGAPSWPKAVKKVCNKKVKTASVSHKKFQFVNKLRKKPVGASRTAGTQCIDRWWESLDAFVPRQLSAKTHKGGPVNQRLFNYCFAFAWRAQLAANADLRAEVGKIC